MSTVAAACPNPIVVTDGDLIDWLIADDGCFAGWTDEMLTEFFAVNFRVTRLKFENDLIVAAFARARRAA
jgi:hypothetical protein